LRSQDVLLVVCIKRHYIFARVIIRIIHTNNVAKQLSQRVVVQKKRDAHSHISERLTHFQIWHVMKREKGER
jgi:hypothetical protein